MTSFQSTVRTLTIVDTIAANSICVFGIGNAIGDAALEALSCCEAMDVGTTELPAEADPDEPEGAAEDGVELGIFVSVARVMVLVTPCEATTTTEVPI